VVEDLRLGFGFSVGPDRNVVVRDAESRDVGSVSRNSMRMKNVPPSRSVEC
jgi:hypothetical protein